MKYYNTIHKLFLIFIGIAILLAGCKKDDPDPDPEPDPGIPSDILLINNWIWEGMNELYLWEEFLPNLDPKVQQDPEAYFYDLLYKDDRDSWIVDDYEALLNMFQGVELSTGMSVSPGIYDDPQVISIVRYVVPNTPAADSGIVRGDIIVSIDGKSLTKDNYFDLYYQTTATFGFATFNGTVLIPKGKEITLTAQELNMNPFVHHEIIDYQGHKVGYFVYTDFVPGPNDEWMNEINVVLGDFKSAGVTDVIVDLRYNGGGYAYVAEYMASVLAPESVLNGNNIFSTQIWNEGFTQYWKDADLNQDGKADGNESERLQSRFPEPEVNLNMSKLYFLTTGSTASASELLMVGFYPYAEVIQIGTTTYGKCYGSVTIDDWEEPKRHNWAMQPIVLKYANSEGFTDFVDGLVPDFVVEESLLNAAPFGSMEDPLLARALEQIAGISTARKKSAEPGRDFSILPVPRKPLEEIKLDWPHKAGNPNSP